MRRLLLLALVLSFGTVLVFAQDHQNTAEKTVKESITFYSDTRVGQDLLKAGEYRIMCDRETITFRNSDGKTFKYPCKGHELKNAADHNEIHATEGPNKTRVLTLLLIKGSNVEHVF